LPFEPSDAGNPVFWIDIQSGIELYVIARDLALLYWFEHGIEAPQGGRELPERRLSFWDRLDEEYAAAGVIPFWSELAGWNVRTRVAYESAEPEVVGEFEWETD